MSSNNESTTLILLWTSTSSKINSYFSIFLLLVGTIGNVLNLFVLSQRKLRSNPCAWLFFVSSIFNLISLLSGLTTKLFSDTLFNLIDRVKFLCQLRAFILLTSRTIAAWSIMLATFDRWLLSCTNIVYRNMSTLKNARQQMIIIVVISLLIYCPIFHCYQANLSNSPLKCYSQSIPCRIFFEQIYTLVTILIPLIFMVLFGILTMSNVRKLHHRFQIPLLTKFPPTAITSEHRQRLKSIDRRLLIMLLIQISFLTLLTLPQALEMIYLTITRTRLKSPLQHTIENSIFNFSLLLTYLASGIPFYIYTLSGGRVFREEVYLLFRKFEQLLCCRH